MENLIQNTKEILEFYCLAGVDETCGNKPFVITPSPSVTVTAARPASSDLAMSSVSALQNAGDICTNVHNLEELRTIIENFDGCNLKNTAAHTVVGDGNPKAEIMLIGEAPGADEDLIGRPFVGRCGQLLDKIMNATGLNRSVVYICNILPWRPPGNRPPSDAEIAVCLPFVKKQIELVAPNYIITLGAIATNSLLNTNDTMSHLRGHWFDYEAANKKIKVLATYHPSYLLRTPAQKNKVWTDFLRFKKEFTQNNQQPV